MNKSIVITGGAGYIGSVAAELFKRAGWQVIIVDDLSTGFEENIHGNIFYKADFADAPWIEDAARKYNPSLLMHFAALALVGESMENPYRYYENNIAKFAALLQNMVKHGIPRIIFSSSAAVYGEPSSIPITEEHPLRPNNVYGHTKKIAEEILNYYYQIYGLAFIALRYFNAGGAALEFQLGEHHANETHLIPNLLLAAIGKKPEFQLFGNDYPTQDGTCVRDFIHVLDIAHAHYLAAQHLYSKGSPDVFNIGNEKGFSIKEIITAANDLIHHASP